MSDDFHGAKLAILVRDRIVTILRDDMPTIPWPAHWDLPGGGREGDESPLACVLRELCEELGLAWSQEQITWSGYFPNDEAGVWFFVAEQPDFDPDAVLFGNEGQGWRLAPIHWFLDEARSIPAHRECLKTYLAFRPRVD